MIYLDSCALLKFVVRERETGALRAWRDGLPGGTEFMTSALARVEVARTLRRVGLPYERVPFIVDEAFRWLYIADLTPLVLERAAAYRFARLGSLDAIHLATADPLRDELTDFVTYDKELSQAARDLGLLVTTPE